MGANPGSHGLPIECQAIVFTPAEAPLAFHEKAGRSQVNSWGRLDRFCEDAQIANRYQHVPNTPKTALIMLSANERPSNIDQAKSDKA